MTPIDQHITEIRNLCQKHDVKELYVFGSITDSNRFTPQSDIDFIVRFKDEVKIEDYADIYFELIEELEELFKRKIDLLLDNPIRNKYLRNSIESSKQQIYVAA